MKRHAILPLRRIAALLLALALAASLTPAYAAQEDGALTFGDLTPEMVVEHNRQMLEERWLNYYNDLLMWKTWGYQYEDRVLAQYGVDLDRMAGSSYNYLYTVSDLAVEGAQTDLEKVRSITQFVCDHLSYGTNGAVPSPTLTLWQYGCGLCENYAALVCALIQFQDIPCVTITGPSLQLYNGKIGAGPGHAWNAVYIDGEWLYIDATWMDTGGEDWNAIPVEEFSFRNGVGHWASVIHGQTTLTSEGRYDVQDPTSGVVTISKPGGRDVTWEWSSPSPSDWAKADVWQAETVVRIVPGALEATYQKNITREEFAMLVMRMWGKIRPDTIPAQLPEFVDSSKTEVRQAAALGFVQGDGTGFFHPNMPITRQDAAAILQRVAKAAGLTGADSADLWGSVSYSDRAEISDYAQDPVRYVTRVGLMQGSAGAFHPKNNITKEQAILTVYRFFLIDQVE